MSGQSLSFMSLSRIGVIAGHTFTQLVRMKVFYFLVFFAVLMLGLQFVDMSQLGAVQEVDQNLRLIKGGGFFAMNVFSILLALSATALLLPKDIEDRTLYTILCKPVPRLDYLLGKLVGVMMLVGLGLLVMDGLFCWILSSRVESMVSEIEVYLRATGKAEDVIAERVAGIRAHGLSWSVQAGVLAVFWKALVVASIALLVSTFSTSTIFTIMTTVVVIVVGLIQSEAREYFLEQQGLGKTTMLLEMTRWVALFFPDFKLLGIEDGVINGESVSLKLMGKVSLIALEYTGIYTVLAWFVFRRKEL